MKAAALALATFLAIVPVAGAAWRPPVDGPVLRGFALSGDSFAAGQHRGVDLAAPLGAPIRAACGGRVRFAGRLPGGGRTVSVGCGHLIATYQHLSSVAVRDGQVVVAGATLGAVGRSGRPRVGRAHVHVGAREAVSGRYVDPLSLLGAAPRFAPPLPSARRRRPPLGPAPRTPQRRPAPSPAPAPAGPVPARAPGAGPAPRSPLAVWIGLLAFGLGLPLGGLRRRRRRRGSRAAASTRARGWAPAHR